LAQANRSQFLSYSDNEAQFGEFKYTGGKLNYAVNIYFFR